jgi:predicted ATPase
VKDGIGQVVLLSGEAGIGKSRLVQVLTEQVATEPQAWLTPCQCSPYHQNTALYPMIDLLERMALRFEREDSPQQKLRKLEGFLVQYGLPLAEAVPLFAALLSLPLTADYAPLPVPPEQQKQQILQSLLTILLRIAAQQPVLFVMEDLHWVDPTTLELLTLLVDQGPTARILALWTFRPDFSPPWTGRAHLTQVTLPRLPRPQATAMADRVARGKTLPAEVVEQVVAKTDGVPLFVEELTKMVLESGLLQEREGRYDLTGPLPPLAIPATLHDSLMARLDRLAAVKSLAQLGATLGREFAYELLHAVAPWDEATVQRGLQQLVEAEFLYQQGLPPQATYRFKHALIQDAAYQSLLRSTRQQYHQRIVQVLEARFPTLCATQPEVLAHHCTEAGLHVQALGYWQQAGQQAIERSAHLEAVSHLRRGLEVLATLPETSERLHQEMALQLTLGPALMATRGYGAPEVGHTYARAHALCQHSGTPQQQFQALWGLWRFHVVGQAVMQARPLAEQLFALAQQAGDPTFLLAAHNAVGITLFYLGEFTPALASLEAAMALYDPAQHRALAFRYGQDPGVICYAFAALTLWMLGYPDQSLQRSQAALAHAQDPFSCAYALFWTALPPQFCGRRQTVSAQAETAVALSTEQQFALWKAGAMMLQGWAQAHQGHAEAGLAQVRRGLTHWRATGAQRPQPYLLALLAETYQGSGHVHEGLTVIAEALAEAERYGERWWEAELQRLKGTLLLAQRPRQESEAEACFHQAITLAAGQQARSLELRAAVSLGRLWQHQGQHARARQLVAPRYTWFTEGFETVDITEAKHLLEELRLQH